MVRDRLNRQRALEREVKRIPLVDRQLIPLIGDYELHNGEIVVNGEPFVEDLLPLYRILGITADNAADSFDKTILSHPEVIALFHSHD